MMDLMRPPPASLPSPRSRKWHSRGWWDSLGYFRVRTLANPNWNRDPSRVIHWLRTELVFDRGAGAVSNTAMGRELLEKAIREAEGLKHLSQRAGETDAEFALRADRRWDAMLATIDQFLELRQKRHLADVDRAACSGRTEPN